MSPQELAQKYAQQIINKEKKFENILQEINKITYTENGKIINKETKNKILREIYKILEFKWKGFFTKTKSFDTDDFNNNVSHIQYIISENEKK